jgi:cysteine desulfurase
MIIDGKIYLDYNATTPVTPEIAKTAEHAMLQAWGNPGSSHQAGRAAATIFEKARARTASLINCSPDEIIFTSGGTESNNAVIFGVAEAQRTKGNHIITSRIEHPALLAPCQRLETAGFDITIAGVDSNGQVNPEEIGAAITPATILVSIMLANNETGAIQPIGQIGKICRKKGVLLHTDAAQAVGKIPVDVKVLNVDYLTIAGHKLYAPKGTGALYIRKGAPLAPLMHGGGQQAGLRPGTEPVPLAAALGKACELAKASLAEEMKRETALKENFFKLLTQKTGNIYRYSSGIDTLPNTLCLAFPGIAGHKILAGADGIMASTGAACHSGDTKISHVITAMGIPKHIAMGTVRLSLGRFTDQEQVETAAMRLAEAVRAATKL